MRKVMTIGCLVVALVAFLGAEAAFAGAEKKPSPSAKIRVKMTSAAFIVGVQWGKGTLTMNDGRKTDFKVSGLQALGIGVSEFEAVGRVFNLKSPKQIEGIYTAVKADIAVAGGAGVLAMKNAEGVEIHLEGVERGLNLTLGPAGMEIKLK